MAVLTAAVGASVPRVDGAAKAAGEALFLDDLAVPGALHGATVRAPVPRGVLRALRLDLAFDWDDVTLVTAQEVPGRNVVPLVADDQPALVPIRGEIRHAGEAVALVAAPTRRRAREAAARIELDVDPLPGVFTLDEALAAGDRVLKELHLGHGDVDAALAGAPVVVEGTYRTGPADQLYLEPQAALAEPRPDGSMHVTASLQNPYYVHAAVAAVLGLPAARVTVEQAVTGGGFGGKEEYPSVVAAHAALLARATGRAVKLVYDRAEDLGVTPKRHPALVRSRLGAAADGTFLAVDVDLVLDAGAYVTLSPLVLLRACTHAAGPYRVGAVRIRGRAVRTNNPPSGAYRGFGAPQALFAAERQVARAARALGLDPLELRRRNALAAGDVTATGGRLDASAGLADTLDALEAALAEPARHPRRARGPVRRGRGLAAGFHGVGLGGAAEVAAHAAATVEATGTGRYLVHVASAELGQGARTTLAQIAADALGVELALVDVPPPDTRAVPDSGPTVASRTVAVVGGLVERAARRLREELDGREEGAAVAVTETYQRPPGVAWDEETSTGVPFATYGWSACAVDVAVDDDTSEVTVERCVQAVDCGRAINPLVVLGQVHGGTAQALGWALWERCEREGGRVLTRSLATSPLATALDLPYVEARLVEVPWEHGPFGAKGVGELPLDVPAAAVANAVEDALGVAPDELPLRPETLRRLREEARP